MAVRFAPLNDGSHKSRLEAQVTGSGKAWISTNGKTIRGTWKKPGSGARRSSSTADGKQGHADPRADLRPGGAAEREDHRHARPGADGVDGRDRRGRGPDRGRRAVHLLGPGRSPRERAAAPRLEHRRRSRDLGPHARASRARRPPTSARRRPAPGPRRPASRAGRRPTRPRGSPWPAAPGRPARRARRPARRSRAGRRSRWPRPARRRPSRRARRSRTPRTGRAGRGSGPRRRARRGARRAAAARRRSSPGRPRGRPPATAAARSPGVAPTRHTRGGHSASGTDAGGGSSASARERGEQRRQVLAGVVAAGVDGVSLAQPEPLALEAGTGRRLRPVGRARGERDDPQPRLAHVEQPPRLARGRARRDEHGAGVLEQARPQPLAEAGDGAALVGLGHRPRREVEQGGDDRDARRDGQAGARGVVDGPQGAAVAVRAPARAHRRAAEHERIDGQGARPEQPGRREPAHARRPRGAASDRTGRRGRRRAGTRTTRPAEGRRRGRRGGPRGRRRSAARARRPAAAGGR